MLIVYQFWFIILFFRFSMCITIQICAEIPHEPRFITQSMKIVVSVSGISRDIRRDSIVLRKTNILCIGLAQNWPKKKTTVIKNKAAERCSGFKRYKRYIFLSIYDYWTMGKKPIRSIYSIRICIPINFLWNTYCRYVLWGLQILNMDSMVEKGPKGKILSPLTILDCMLNLVRINQKIQLSVASSEPGNRRG